MRDLAPDVMRQRLLLEGYYTVPVDQATVEGYLTEVVGTLELRAYGEPIVRAPGALGKPGNAGFDAFVPLIDSGISLYVWSAHQFFAAVFFSCKRFDVARALRFTSRYFGTTELEHREF